MSVKYLTPPERKKSQIYLMFLTEKKDKFIRVQMMYNGNLTRKWLTREDFASTTAYIKSIMICDVVDTKEERYTMTADATNYFIQALMNNIKDDEERVMKKITGVMVDMLVKTYPVLYGPNVVYDHGRRVIYVQLLRDIYGMLQSSLLWYKKF